MLNSIRLDCNDVIFGVTVKMAIYKPGVVEPDLQPIPESDEVMPWTIAFGWVGFKTYWLPYENVERVAGETKWNFWKLFKYALDGIVNFSLVPLTLSSWMGILMTFVAFIMLIVIIIRKIVIGDPVAGWASLICVIIFIGGLIMLSLVFCNAISIEVMASSDASS